LKRHYISGLNEPRVRFQLVVFNKGYVSFGKTYLSIKATRCLSLVMDGYIASRLNKEFETGVFTEMKEVFPKNLNLK
jgi:hypothetical protein